MREFKNAKELLALCSEKDLPISEIMRQREIIIGEMQEQEVNARMTHVLEIMKEAAFSPIKHPVKSMGGLIGGESKKLFRLRVLPESFQAFYLPFRKFTTTLTNISKKHFLMLVPLVILP